MEKNILDPKKVHTWHVHDDSHGAHLIWALFLINSELICEFWDRQVRDLSGTTKFPRF